MLKKQLNKYKLLYEKSPDMQISVDPVNAQIKECNQTTADKTGYKKTEIIGKSIFNFYHPKSLPDVKKAFEDFQKTGRVSDVELLIVTKSGDTIPILLNTEAIRDEDGKILYSNSTWKDISEIKKLQNELQYANDNLERKVDERTNELEVRNKELEQFVYIASHDLQEPLRTISNFISLLQLDSVDKLSKDEVKYLEIIAQSSNRMSQLVKGLLDYARIGRDINLENIDCNEVIRSVKEDLSLKITESNATIKICSDLPQLVVFGTGFRLLMQNLISNALKFKKEGVDPYIKINANQESGFWQFSVEDNGIGIAEEHKGKVFKIFQRLYNRKQYEGTGIGLAQCQKIVDLHNGKIWVESILGEGTTFFFKIPDNL